MQGTNKSSAANIFRLPYRLVFGTSGINPIRSLRNLGGIPFYIRDLVQYSWVVTQQKSLRLNWAYLNPQLSDRHDEAGSTKTDYFLQDLWMARKIFSQSPKEHWDIASRIDGFVAHLLTFRDVNVIDIRKLESQIPGLTFHQGNITALNIPDQSIESLSCLHAMEHVGLGRYGDPIDPDGCFKGMKELQRVLAPKGRLYFSVPLGKERVEFNAHRVFAPSTVIKTFSELNLIDFAVISANGELIESTLPSSEIFDQVTHGYICGLFILERP
jgi:hypothetical protein